jgi:hypothetical protein
MPKRIKFIAVGDNHGDMVDTKSAKEFYKFCERYDAQHRIHLGDCYDFRSIRKGASDSDENESLVKDVIAGNNFVKNYSPTVFLYGNHEDRIFTMMNSTKSAIIRDAMADLESEINGVLADVKCKVIKPYHAELGVWSLNKISFVHGYSCGVRAVEEHAIHYADKGGALIMGHIHSIQQTNAKKFGGAVGFSGGCLCKKQAMNYAKNRMATSKWGTGWLYGFVEGNNWKVWQAHKVGENFIYSHNDI